MEATIKNTQTETPTGINRLGQYSLKGVEDSESLEGIKKQLRAELRNNPEFIDKFVDFLSGPAAEIIHTEVAKGIAKVLSQVACVLSLTEIRDNEVMWAHYGDSHRGIVLGFDSSESWFKEHFKIQYLSELPRFETVPCAHSEEERRLLMHQVFGRNS